MGDPVRRDAFAAAYGLTPRERETAERIALGLSYKETAYELGISIKTVKAHMSSVYEKTGAASNVALALLMRGLGRSSTKVQ
jgi:DNA-binding CsgD family transcriptional regulator